MVRKISDRPSFDWIASKLRQASHFFAKKGDTSISMVSTYLERVYVILLPTFLSLPPSPPIATGLCQETGGEARRHGRSNGIREGPQ